MNRGLGIQLLNHRSSGSTGIVRPVVLRSEVILVSSFLWNALHVDAIWAWCGNKGPMRFSFDTPDLTGTLRSRTSARHFITLANGD